MDDKASAFFLLIRTVNMKGNNKICDISVYDAIRPNATDKGVDIRNKMKL